VAALVQPVGIGLLVALAFVGIDLVDELPTRPV
jgi:hypothetical protein